MTRLRTLSTLASLGPLASSAFAIAMLAAPKAAIAQAPPLSESVVIGAWTFRPSAELRVRGEYRRDPVELNGTQIAVQADGENETSPVTYIGVPPRENAWAVSERTRLGLAVDRGPVTGALIIQDSRVLGEISGTGRGNLGTLAGLGGFFGGMSLHEAYIDVHARSGRPMFLRIGRQKVVWGDGRLIGESDWSPAPRALNAARFGFQVSDFDVELLAALLVPPGSYSKPSATTGKAGSAGQAASGLQTSTGAQLYGVDITWHFLPLLNAELTGLARFARASLSTGSPLLTPGDTYVIDARFFGEQRGFRYSLEGAYELGRVASYDGVNREIGAFAAAARASLETALPAHLTFGAHGAFASGDDGPSNPAATLTRFDPVLPDEFSNHGPMGLYAWSNVIEAGGNVTATPIEEVRLEAGYRFAALASPNGRWTTASLVAVGAESSVASRVLGHEVDLSVTFTPWEPIEFKGGYGLFVFGDKAQAILTEIGSDAGMQHWGYLQALVRAP